MGFAQRINVPLHYGQNIRQIKTLDSLEKYELGSMLVSVHKISRPNVHKILVR